MIGGALGEIRTPDPQIRSLLLVLDLTRVRSKSEAGSPVVGYRRRGWPHEFFELRTGRRPCRLELPSEAALCESGLRVAPATHRLEPMLARLRRLLANATAPGAPCGRRADPSSIPTAVDYALQLATGYMEHFSRLGVEVARSAILELGPGADLGAQLILASHGARVTVADPFPVRWDPRFHPTYYA